jgi:crotonobetaine/carnitine-CoA ligase
MLQPDAPWIVGTEGETLTFGQAHSEIRQVASYLSSQGIGPGDRVFIFAGNSCDFIRAWLGLLSIGGVAVLLNTELRGAFLLHQLQDGGADLAIVDASLIDVVREVCADSARLKRVLLVGGEPLAKPGDSFAIERFDAWRSCAAHEGALPQERDIACVMYTSGTSGPSKGVLMPHAHCTLYGIGAVQAAALTADDRYYIVLPLFHANGLLMQLGATLLAGIPAILRPRFSASAWIDDIRVHGATVTSLLGVLVAFVVGQPPAPGDRDHSLRAVLNGPNSPVFEAALRERFGVRDVLSGFGMTEANMPIWGRLGHSRPGAAGWVHAEHFDLVIADPETDRELPRGRTGEILIRPKVPWGFMAGYHGMPGKTVEAWRNLWFHTGDAAVMDEDGLVTFVDRIKDSIRRRGENIAAGEVEALLAGLPGVAEIAAYAVASDIPGGEDELMLAVVAAEGTTLSLEDFGARAEALLPRFARPRYVKLIPELPKTATGKVQRAVLRKEGPEGALDRRDRMKPGLEKS